MAAAGDVERLVDPAGECLRDGDRLPTVTHPRPGGVTVADWWDDLMVELLADRYSVVAAQRLIARFSKRVYRRYRRIEVGGVGDEDIDDGVKAWRAKP